MQEKIKKILIDITDMKFLKDCLITIIFGLIINFSLFFLCSITGHCANEVISVLPYLPQNENTFYDETMINTVLSEIDNKYPNDDIYSQHIIVSLGAEYNWYTYNDYIQVPTYRVYVIPNPVNIASTWSSGSNFGNFQMDNSNYWLELNIIPWTSYTVQPNYQGSVLHYAVSKSNSSGVTSVRLFGAFSPVTINNSFYNVQVPNYNYPVYCNCAITTTDPTLVTSTVLSYYTGEVYPGDFVDLPPLENILNNITNSWNNSTDTTLPNTDNNASVSDNLRNFLSTMQVNISNSINNLGSNIKSYFDKVQQKLTDTTNAILGGIHDGFATLNQNFKDFFGAKLDAILDKLEDIKNALTGEDLTMQDLKEEFENTAMFSDYEDITDMADTFKSTFDISEPLTYKIPIHFEDIPSLNYNKTEYIDLDVITPVKSLLRTFMWALCTYSIFITILDAIPNYINGGGDE